MQIACPWCSYPLVIEDAKVPPQKFLTRCPKCTGAIQVPGTETPDVAPAKHGPPPKNASAAGNGNPPTHAAPPKKPAASAPHSTGAPTPQNGGLEQRALVALQEGQWASTLASLLNEQGYDVESLNPWQEKVRLLHQGDYDVVVTAPSGPVLDDGKTLHRRMDHLSPEARRRTFLILVGDEFKTGDGNQAFVAAADLVVHPSELGNIGTFLPRRLEERARVYRAFDDAEKRRGRHR